jgi:murein DD-endopeptidase MepM/ murein hydrolase activator NlpD
VAQTDTTTTTSEPPATDPPLSRSSTTTTTTTSVPSTSTSTTTTTAPPSSSTGVPSDTVTLPTAAEQLAATTAFATLSDDQRALLRRLQRSRDDLAAARLKLLALGALVDGARGRLAVAQRAVDAAEADVDGATRDLSQVHAEVAELAGAMYQNVDDDVLLDTVNTADHSDMNRIRTYAHAPQDVLDAMVARAAASKRELIVARDHAADARATASDIVSSLQAALTKQQDALATAEHASTEAFEAVTAALGSNVALLGQVADPHFGADDITEALAVAQAGEGEPVTLIGAFRVPVRGAPLGSPYGIRVDPLTGALGYHPGIDFEASAGTEVHAAAPGTVVIAGDCGGYGNCVVIDHGHSLATVSAHLSRVLVDVGQPVADGQVVGLVGSTGRSTGPHLHFEARLHGAPIDPVATLTA